MSHSTLDQIDVGNTAIITDFAATETNFRRKLLALGLMPGATVMVVRRAPMGDPIQLKMRGASVTLRKQEAANIKAKTLS